MLKKSASTTKVEVQAKDEVKKVLSLPNLDLILRTRCGLAWARRVSARQGWEGEKSDLFEHPA
jgi:hypothetical protein